MNRYSQIAIAFVVATFAGAAGAQTTVITREPARSDTVVTTQSLELTPVQRQTIYRMIVREPRRPPEAVVEYHDGIRVPTRARLYWVPNAVAVQVPVVRQYKYMVVNNRVVLVDPATSEVVAEIGD